MELEFARVRALVFEPYTLFRVQPMTGRYVNVTEHGYRCGSHDDVWPPDPAAGNVFIFGGSTAFGYGVADADTIPSQLADQLAGLLPGKRFSVYNFATPNYDGVQERIRLEQMLLNGHVPRIAIFIDGFDEFIAPYYAPLMLKPFVDATNPRSGRRGLMRMVRELSRQLLGRAAADGADESRCQLPDPARVLDRYFTNVRLIKAVCHAFGVRPLFVWQPVPCYRWDGEARHGAGHGGSAPLIDCVRAGYEMMNSRRADDFTGDEFLWLADMQEGRADNLYVDADHYTPGFSREIASRIAQYLIDDGLMG